jgi:hypothetical protein
MRCSSRPAAWLLVAIGLAAALAASPALAHKSSEAFLELRPQSGNVAARWDIALRDLDLLLDLDADGDGSLQWGEVKRRKAALADYASQRIEFSAASGSCAGSPMLDALARRNDGTYAVLRWHVECPRGERVSGVRYRLLSEVDATHRVVVSLPGAAVELRALRASDETQPLDVDPSQQAASHDVAGFLLEGMRHILHGTDHLAFLLALLIPAIAFAGVSADALRPALGELLRVVSVFTLAHSITLGLTAMGMIGLPSRWVESMVALSVVAGGLQALVAAGIGARTPAPDRGLTRQSTRFRAAPLWLVFAFGLIHGIGFGSALQGAGVGGRSVMAALLGFNIGVEVGQLAVLAVIFPLAWTLRNARGFRQLAMPACALLIVIFGASWFAERALDIGIDLAVAPGLALAAYPPDR